ncbi:hypothetical protein BH20ACT15_BH20ACT15_01260 [soil metagenome]
MLSDSARDPSQPVEVLMDERGAATAIAASSLVELAAGVLAILFIRQASARQQERIAAGDDA